LLFVRSVGILSGELKFITQSGAESIGP